MSVSLRRKSIFEDYIIVNKYWIAAVYIRVNRYYRNAREFSTFLGFLFTRNSFPMGFQITKTVAIRTYYIYFSV